MEILYCSFMNIFGIVDADSPVWDDPLYPFMVYGIGVLVCAIALVPLRIQLVKRRKTMWAPHWNSSSSPCLCMAMELAMGFLLNQPDAAGNYPLWDNSQLPGNILGQAWIVNGIGLGAVGMLYTWVIYPLRQKTLAKVPIRIMRPAAAIVVVGFVVLCVVKFS